MRSTSQSHNSSRSPALQQYDEARKNAAVGSNCSSSPSKARPSATQARTAAAEPRQDDGWSLCGWQDEPSVPAAARAASAKLVQHQTALSPAQLPSTQQPATASSSTRTSSGGSRRAAGPASGSNMRQPQVVLGPAQRSRPLKPQRPAGRKLQLGEEDSYSTAAEHYRPPALGCSTGISTAVAEVTSADDASASGAAAGSSRGQGTQEPVQNSSSWDGCHLPSLHATHLQQHARPLQQQQASCSQHAGGSMPSLKPIVEAQQQQPCITSAPGTNSSGDGYEQQSARVYNDLCDWVESVSQCESENESESEDSSLYAPRCDSRAGIGAGLLPGTGSSRSLLPSSSIGNNSSSTNSVILALQQRLLPQAQPGLGCRSSGGGSSSCGSVLQGSSQATAAGSLRPLSGSVSGSGRPPGSAGLLMRGLGTSGALGATAATALHARMASTAARAQLLLTQELTSMVPPPAPRLRPESACTAAAAGGAAGAPAAAAASTVAAGVLGDSNSSSIGQQLQQQWGSSQLSDTAAGAAPALRFVGSGSRCTSSNRPSSAARTGSSQAGAGDAGGAARSSCVPGDAVGTLLYSPQAVVQPCGSYSNASNLTSSSGCCTAGGAVGSSAGTSLGSFSRRPVSAGVGGPAAGVRWGSSSGSEGGGSSGRPSTSGSMLGAMTSGSGAGLTGHALSQQSKGLSAAADYLACRSTVAELLQRVNSQKATAAAGAPPLTARTPHQPGTAAAAAAGVGAQAAMAMVAAGDTSFSRDGRPAAAVGHLMSSGSGKVAASRQVLGLTGTPAAERCSSLKAYQAFQSGRNLGSSSSLSGSSSSSSRQALVKSISSGPSIMASHLHINSSALELRATAALRKCGSSKQ